MRYPSSLRALATRRSLYSFVAYRAKAWHGAFYLEFVAARDGRLAPDEPREAAAEIWGELDNVRQAWTWTATYAAIALLERAAYGWWQSCLLNGLDGESRGHFGLAADHVRTALDGLGSDDPARPTHQRALSTVLAIHANHLFSHVPCMTRVWGGITNGDAACPPIPIASANRSPPLSIQAPGWWKRRGRCARVRTEGWLGHSWIRWTLTLHCDDPRLHIDLDITFNERFALLQMPIHVAEAVERWTDGLAGGAVERQPGPVKWPLQGVVARYRWRARGGAHRVRRLQPEPG